MIPDGTYTAVVDRLEDGVATLQIETGEESIEELILDAEQLPEAGRHADAVLSVELREQAATAISYDAAATEQRREQAQNRFDRLSERLSDDDTQ